MNIYYCEVDDEFKRQPCPYGHLYCREVDLVAALNLINDCVKILEEED